MAIQTNTISLFLTFFFFLDSCSICHSNSLEYLDTFHPSTQPSIPPSFPPHNAPPPLPPPSKYPTSLPTAAGVASASTLVTVGFIFFLCNKSARDRKKDGSSGGSGGGGGCAAVTPYPVAKAAIDDGAESDEGAAAEAGMMNGNVKELIVDHKVNLVDDQQTATVVAPPSPPPLPPPIPCKTGVAPPPPAPPPKRGGASVSPRPPLAPKRSSSGNVVDDGTEDKSNQIKLKPLHWEKVNVVNRPHSMVWDNLEHGSFQYNGDMMEALFGKVATPQNPPKDGNTSQNLAAKISIFDSRRSQNIAIVIRSLGGIQMKELIEALLEGKGLNVQILEKLTRIALPEEEKIKILSFDGEVERLCDAESFLYRLLKAVPLAFTRINAMLFRYTYDSEIEQLKVTLQTLESACDELRNPRVFLKLLEATLKAGNRVNAGTARGEAKAFNLTALLKLSDYKSSDGKSTLLHFVVHEVARNEGKKRWVMKNQSPIANPCELKPNSEQQKEFLKAGLPIVGGLSSEFSNVKKSAIIDYHTLSDISSLGARLDETRELILHCGAESGQEEFIREMEEFLRGAEGEIKVFQEEKSRVMELVKKTTQYYQSGGFNEKRPLELFAIVKDFLGMVDKACVNISKDLEEKKGNSASKGSLAPPSSLSLPSTPDFTCIKISKDLEDKAADSAGNDSLAPPLSLALPSTPDVTCINISEDLENKKPNSAWNDSLAPALSPALPSTPDFTCVKIKDLEDNKADSVGNDSLAPPSSLALPSTPDVTCINISKALEDKKANSAGNDSLAPPLYLALPSAPDVLMIQGTFLRLPDYSISEKSNSSSSDDDF